MLVGAVLYFNSLHNSVKCVLLLFTFYREKSNCLPKATHLITGRVKIRIQFCNFQDSAPFGNFTASLEKLLERGKISFW